MDAFYSSDEDIACGPVTLREIKGDLKRPALRKPIRRHTSHCEQTTKIDKMSIASEDTILEISAYLTASEVASIKNDTQYYSTDENVIKNNLPADESTSGLDRSVNKLFQESPLSCETTDKSHLNLVQNAMDKSSNVIKTEHETFVESSINMNESLYVIEISSEDEVEQVETISSGLEMSDGNISYCSEKYCSKQEEYCEIESYFKDSDDLLLDQSAISESKYPTTSAITIPDIDLQQFNDSSICPLNDTIEKINAILNQADDKSFTESSIKASHIEYEKNNELNIGDLSISSICKQNSKSNISGDEENFQTVNLISGSFLQKPMSDFSPKTPNKHLTPINSNFTIKSHIPVPKRSPDSFKVPTLPAQKSKPNLKNIISPVRMYIKYSPKPVLKRYMDSSESKKLQKPTNSKNKENMDVIPSNILYKPSKNPVLGSEMNINMPESLEKMVVKSTVTRHVRKPVSVSLFRKDVSLDPGLDLTTASLNVGQFSENDQNMSVLHKTPAFRK